MGGMIAPLDDWVLHAAVLGCAALQAADHRPWIAVNVSAEQLSQPGFASIVLSTLAGVQLPADRLVLEVTESALLDELGMGVQALVQLRSHGVRVSIDDFGTGYSSLSRLSRLPVDELKVDKSFIEQLQPGTTAFVMAGAAEALGSLDVPALRRALVRLVGRHPALRTAFAASGGQPVQRVRECVEVDFTAVDAAGWSASRRSADLSKYV